MSRESCRRPLFSFLTIAVASMCVLSHDAFGQFSQVINAPPTVIGSFQSIGSNTQLNVSEGGSVGNFFSAGNSNGSSVNVEVNLTGGTIGSAFQAYRGSTINVSGGRIGTNFNANNRSTVDVSGGYLAGSFYVHPGSKVRLRGGRIFRLVDEGGDIELVGSEFRLNGVAVTTSTVTLGPRDVFSMTLADGTSTIFSRTTNDDLSNAKLTVVPVPPVNTTPIIVDAANPIAPYGLRAGQSLTLREGQSLDSNFQAVAAPITIEGGIVGNSLEVVGAAVQLTDGAIGDSFSAYRGTVVNVDGGTIGNNFEANSGSVVFINNGTVKSGFQAFAESEVTINNGTVGGIVAFEDSAVRLNGGSFTGFVRALGGSVVHVTGGVYTHYTGSTNTYDGRFNASAGSVVRISGGIFQGGADFDPSLAKRGLGSLNVEQGSDVELSGGHFRLNGQEYTGTNITLTAEDVFTGVLSDGSPFIFTPIAGDVLNNVSLRRTSVPTANTTPIIVDGNTTNAPLALQKGQSLTLRSGGTLTGSFQAIGATLNLDGGIVGEIGEVAEGVVNLSDGTISMQFKALAGTVVNISGGIVHPDFEAHHNSEVNISGGFIADGFRAYPGSAVNIYARDVFVNGQRIDDLELYQKTIITRRNVSVSGILADGQRFSFWLDPKASSTSDYFSQQAILTVTLVPEPETWLLMLATVALGWLLPRSRKQIE